MRPLDSRPKIETHQYMWILNSRTIIEDIEDDEAALKPPEDNIISFNELDAYLDINSEIGNYYMNILYSLHDFSSV